MSAPLIVKSSITSHASATKVWDVLTKPEYTEQYMFGCTIDADWKIGGPFLWKGVFDGKELVAVKGTLVEKEDARLLAYTTFDPNTPMEDIPANYTTVTYTLQPHEDEMLLTVTQGDFANVADSERRYKETYNNGEGWNPILVQVKALAEAQ